MTVSIRHPHTREARAPGAEIEPRIGCVKRGIADRSRPQRPAHLRPGWSPAGSPLLPWCLVVTIAQVEVGRTAAVPLLRVIPRRQRLAGGPGQIMGNAHPWPLPGHAANGGESNAELDDAELIRNIKLRVRASRQLPPSQDPMQDERLLHPGPRLTPLGLSSAD